MPESSQSSPLADESTSARQYLGVFRYGSRALQLVWSTRKPLTVAFGLLTLIAGIVPAGIAYVGQKTVAAATASAPIVGA